MKVVAEDLGMPNKAQTEMMMRLSDAIDRLSAASGDKANDRKITVELEMDGKKLHSKILKDTSIYS